MNQCWYKLSFPEILFGSTFTNRLRSILKKSKLFSLKLKHSALTFNPHKPWLIFEKILTVVLFWRLSTSFDSRAVCVFCFPLTLWNSCIVREGLMGSPIEHIPVWGDSVGNQTRFDNKFSRELPHSTNTAASLSYSKFLSSDVVVEVVDVDEDDTQETSDVSLQLGFGSCYCLSASNQEWAPQLFKVRQRVGDTSPNFELSLSCYYSPILSLSLSLSASQTGAFWGWPPTNRLCAGLFNEKQLRYGESKARVLFAWYSSGGLGSRDRTRGI